MANSTSAFPLLLFIHLFFHRISASQSPDAEHLLAFKSTADESNNLLTWTSDTNPCSSSSPWYGVSCFHNRVSKLVLEDLSLSGNFDSLSSLSRLRILSLSRNRFSGQIPNLSNLTSLKLLFLSHNSLSGELPNSLSSLSGLYRLDLSFNNLSGVIPANFSRLNRLLTLKLEGNEFSGPISSLELNDIQDFNVSGNEFEGEIPKSLSGFPLSAFVGNEGLCGAPLSPCKSSSTAESTISPVSEFPSSPSNKTGKIRMHKMSSSAIIAVVIGDFAILAVISLLLVCFFWRSYARQRLNPTTDTEKNPEPYDKRPTEKGKMVFLEGGMKFDLEDLLRASAEMLGKGSTGTVYKATLNDGSVVAVKRMRMDSSSPGNEFEKRMGMVGRLRHPNVAEVKAYYIAKEEKLLVLDFMANGSLFGLLHGNRGPGRTPVDWTTRLKIVAGAARGVAYIHSACKPLELTHGNIKSTNVLIDKAGDARVSDFGFPPPRSLGSCRTNGYRAPEAVRGKPLTWKADVYSFGVLLLEVLTGKCPATVEGSGAEVVDLRKWVETVIQEEWTAEVFDLELMRYKDIEDEMVGLLHIALACTSPSPDQRPTMSQVVKLIDDLRGRTTLLSSSDHSDVTH